MSVASAIRLEAGNLILVRSDARTTAAPDAMSRCTVQVSVFESGQVWLNNLYMDAEWGNLQGSIPDEYYEVPGNATALMRNEHNKGWFPPTTPFNLRVKDPKSSRWRRMAVYP